MVSDRDKLLMSEQEFKAFETGRKIKLREKKTQIRTAIKARKETISRIKKVRSGLGRKLGKSFAKITGRIQGRKRKRKKKATLRRKIKVIEIKIREKKRSKIAGIFEKQQEEESLFFKN